MILACFLLRCSGHELGVRVKRVLTGKSEIVSNKGALLPAQSLFLHSALLYTVYRSPISPLFHVTFDHFYPDTLFAAGPFRDLNFWGACHSNWNLAPMSKNFLWSHFHSHFPSNIWNILKLILTMVWLWLIARWVCSKKRDCSKTRRIFTPPNFTLWLPFRLHSYKM